MGVVVAPEQLANIVLAEDIAFAKLGHDAIVRNSGGYHRAEIAVLKIGQVNERAAVSSFLRPLLA
jgi:hypothetical protein